MAQKRLLQEEYQFDLQSDDFIRRSIGKTIKTVKRTQLRSKSKHMHNDECIEFLFTDGSRLTLEIGSNGDDLPSGRVNASDLSLSFIPLFYDPGEQ